MSKQIPLTRGLVTVVDDDDYPSLSMFKWNAQWKKPSNTYYACRAIKGSAPIHMAREIMGLVKGDKRHVDHINRDTLDNRKENLRILSVSHNQLNRNVLSNHNKSGFTGVLWHSSVQRYEVWIKINGKRKWIGSTNDPAEGSRWYQERVKQVLAGGLVFDRSSHICY